MIATLSSRALVAVDGADWRPFLHNLLTQDVETLQPGQIRFGALLAAQGRLLFDLFIIGRAEGCWLDVAAARRDDLVQRLRLYRLRAKAAIEPSEGSVQALWDAPPGGGWLPDPRLTALGWRGYGLDAAADASEADYHTHRLAVGAPDPDADCPPDAVYPIDADFDLLNGVDFHKGCFIGQEVASRMKRRGQIKNRMMPIAFDGPPPPFGAEVMAGDVRVGEVLTGQAGRAMALLRLDRIEGEALTVLGRPVTAQVPAWWPR